MAKGKRRQGASHATFEAKEKSAGSNQDSFQESKKANLAMEDAKVHEGNEAYRAFMDRLTQSNVDEYIDLPTIAVMGDTSSGKSSLLSMLSQIELPANDKLTTRCPIMLAMHKSTQVSARVRINWKDPPHSGPNSHFEERRVAQDNWGDLTDHIEKAQDHIVSTQKKEVARDIVSVDISGPHCENLTLIDLPGIVRSRGKGECETLSQDIQSLLSDYLNNSRCVILAVLPSNVDFHNSEIMAEALKVDPETSRTIPVLTKPDLIDEGAEESVKELLLGMKTNDFKMGFHMVKGRGQKALDSNTTIEQGIDQEARFFQSTEPWRNVEDKSLFGTKNLRIKLGELQMNLIRSSFDDIVAEIKAQRDNAISRKTQLGSIPEVLMEKITLFRRVKDDYYTIIGPLVMGGRVRTKNVNLKVRPSAEFHRESKEFMSKLNESRLANISGLAIGVDAIGFDNDINGKYAEWSGKIQHITKDHVFLDATFSHPIDPIHIPDDKKIVIKNHAVYLRQDNGKVVQLDPFPRNMVRRDPNWIQDLIDGNRPYKLPIFLNTEIFEQVISDMIIEDWSEPSHELLKNTLVLMTTAYERYIQSIAELSSLPRFRQFLIAKSSEVIEELSTKARSKIDDLIERERTPYTQNHYLFENISKLRNKRLMDEILLMVGDSKGGDGRVNHKSVKTVIENAFERNQARSLDDHMAEEMQHALDAYGKVALKRFIDTIPMICIEVMQNFAECINETLSGVTDSEIEHLVVAPPDRAKAMMACNQKIETLDKGIAAIKQLH